MKRTKIFMNKPAYLGLSILEVSTIVIMYEFGMIMWNQNTEKKQNYVTCIQTALKSK